MQPEAGRSAGNQTHPENNMIKRRAFLMLAVIAVLVFPMPGRSGAPVSRPVDTATAPARVIVVNPALAEANDANPGTDAQPLRTISRAAALVQSGDVVRIHSGVYRERVLIKQSGTKEQPIHFEAVPGAKVIITGADLLTGWTKDEGGTYSVAWPHHLFQGDQHNPRGSEQVFVAGVLLRKVARLDELNASTFFVDAVRQRLCLRTGRNPDDDRETHSVEASVRVPRGTVLPSERPASGTMTS